MSFCIAKIFCNFIYIIIYIFTSLYFGSGDDGKNINSSSTKYNNNVLQPFKLYREYSLQIFVEFRTNPSKYGT